MYNNMCAQPEEQEVEQLKAQMDTKRDGVGIPPFKIKWLSEGASSTHTRPREDIKIEKLAKSAYNTEYFYREVRFERTTRAAVAVTT